MRAGEVNRLRGRIARLRREGMGPTAIAAELGCARSAVYRALGAGGADRRVVGGRYPAEVRAAALELSAGRTLAETVGALGRLVAAGELRGPAPARATVARWVKEAWERRAAVVPAGRTGPGALAEGEGMEDPYADLALDEDGVVAVSDDAAARGELRLVRALLRDAVKELKGFERGTPERYRVRAQAGGLVDVLTRVRRAQKLGAALSPALLRLAAIEDEAAEAALGLAGPAGARALGAGEGSEGGA